MSEGYLSWTHAGVAVFERFFTSIKTTRPTCIRAGAVRFKHAVDLRRQLEGWRGHVNHDHVQVGR
jgi:hypothetical protein